MIILALSTTLGYAFTAELHAAMTRTVLSGLTAVIKGTPRHFSSKAVEDVVLSNLSMDDSPNWGLRHPDYHFLNERFHASTERLVNLRDQVVADVSGPTPNGEVARGRLGEALHLLQDFYAHSNWVELGHHDTNGDLGVNIIADDPPPSLHSCPLDASTLDGGTGDDLTSGYFIYSGAVTVPFSCGTVPTGKCAHGNYIITCRGINKDHAGDSALAQQLAATATQEYVQRILDTLAGNDAALGALLDVRGTVGFVIDDTGSMGPEISGVKEVVTQLVEAIKADPDNRPDEWVLERFGDPDIGPVFVTSSVDDLLAAVNALYAHGGGDCPEYSQGGLLEAIDASTSNSKLFLFTDASAKDSDLANTVISRAQEKGIRISYALTGSCSPIDQAYIRGAEETGGQLFFLDQFELPLLFDLFRPLLNGDVVTILSTQGTLDSTGRSFDIPVDTTVSRLIVSVSMDTFSGLTVRRPSGAVVMATDPGVSIVDLSTARIVTVDTPEFGTWTAELAGLGAYSFVSQANSSLDFRTLAFVEPNQDIHGGFVPIPGQPVAGSEGTAEGSVIGAFSTAAFRLVDASGDTIADVDLSNQFPDADPNSFIGQFTVPLAPFRSVVLGTDANGYAYQRQFSTVFKGQSVVVEVDSTSPQLVPAGQTTPLLFRVTNLGAAQSFRVDAVDDHKFVSGTTPPVVDLANGESRVVMVDVTVPAGTPDGTEVIVTATCTSLSDATIFNSASDTVSVTDRFASICFPGSDGVRGCPCLNPPSDVGRGCNNSRSTGGAVLSALGDSNLSSDSVVLMTSGEPVSAFSILMQGNGFDPEGHIFGQGVRCVGGSIIRRLFIKHAQDGGIMAPDIVAGDPSISTRSALKGDAIQAGQDRWYLVYYRDPIVLGACPAGSTFNATQTLRVSWRP